MAFLRRDSEGPERQLDGDGVILRHPEPRDYPVWARLRGESKAFLQPWEPTWPADELSRANYRLKLRRYSDDIRERRSFPFFTFRASDRALVGGVTLSRVQRGVAQSAVIGYWSGASCARRGHTLAAVRCILAFAFDDLGLHRVEAACQPENLPSKALLERVGFGLEGMARSYLKINGHWRDHLLYGILSSDPIR